MDNKEKEKIEADCPRCLWIQPWDSVGIVTCNCPSEPVIKAGKKPLDRFLSEVKDEES